MSSNNAGRPNRQHDEFNNSEDPRRLSFGEVNEYGDRVPTLEAVKRKCAEKNDEFQERSSRLRQEVNEIREGQTQMRGQLEDHIAQLQEQLNNKNHELQDAQAKICILEHTKSENENSITAARATIRSLEEEKLNWEREKDEYEAEVRSCRQEADTLRMEIQTLKETTVRQSDEIKEHSMQRFSFLKEIQEAMKRADDAESLLANEKRRLTDSADQLNLKLDEIMKEKNDLKDVIAQQEAKNSSIKEYIQYLEERTIALDTGKTNCEKEKSDLRAKCHQLQSQLEEERREKETLTQELNSLRESYRENEELSRRLQLQLYEVKTLNETMAEDLLRLENTCREKEGEVSELTNVKRILEQKIDEKTEDNVTLRRKLNEAKTQNDKLKQNITTLEGTCAEKQDTIDQLRNQSRENLEKITRLEGTISSLLQQKEASEQVETQLRGEVSELTNQKRILQQEIDQKTENCRILQEKLQEAMREHARLTQTVNFLEQTCAEKQGTIDQLSNQRRENLEKITRLEGTVSSLRQELEASNQERIQLAAQNSSISQELAQVRGENNRLQGALHFRETEMQTAQDNLLELGQQNMTHQMQEVEARTELEHFRQQLNARILQTTELSERVLQLEREATSQVAEVDRHRSNVQRLEEQLRDARGLLQSRDENIAALREQVSQLETAVDGARGHHRDIQALLHTKNEELCQCQRDAEETTQRVLQLEREATSQLAEVDRHRSNVQRLEEQLRDARGLLQSRDENIAALREQVRQLETAVDGARLHHRDLEALLNTRNEELFQCRREAEETTHRMRQLEHELRNQSWFRLDFCCVLGFLLCLILLFIFSWASLPALS